MLYALAASLHFLTFYFYYYFNILGSIPERSGNKLYNTSTVFNPEGSMIAKHRKVKIISTSALQI